MTDDALEAKLAQTRLRRRLPPPPVRRALRIQAGLSQADIATRCGVDRAEVSRWEGGTRSPRGGRTLESYVALLDRLRDEAFGASR